MRTAEQIYQAIDEDKKNKEFMRTGFSQVDNSLDGGFLKKEIIILGSFTGIGKSILAGQMFYSIVSQGFLSAYFSLEISGEVLLSRLTGQMANIKPSRTMHGLLTAEELDWVRMSRAEIMTNNMLMHFHDDLYLLGEIEEQITKNKYEFVVIDFIQNILLPNSMDEYTRLSYVAVKLQKLAKATNSCILVCSQLSNRVGSNNSGNVEYKGSGAIAQIADLGFFLTREQPNFDINGQPTGNQAVTLALRKNRRGISGLTWNLEFVHPGGKICEKI